MGFGRVTDQVCEAIHQGLIKRNEAVELVNLYDGKCSDFYINKFCDYLKISKKDFSTNLDKHVNKNLFKKTSGKWIPRFVVK